MTTLFRTPLSLPIALLPRIVCYRPKILASLPPRDVVYEQPQMCHLNALGKKVDEFSAIKAFELKCLTMV